LFESVCAAGKVPDETQELMRSMLMKIDLVLSIFMEGKTRKDSSNSSLPPSQNRKDGPALDADSPGSHKKGSLAGQRPLATSAGWRPYRSRKFCFATLRAWVVWLPFVA